MSTGILYHGWGVRGYVYERGRFVGGGLVFHVRQKARLRCPVCRSAQVIGRGTVERRFKTVPIGLKPVTLVLPVQRVECHVCQAVRQVAVQFADVRRTYTKAFERYAVALCRVATIQDAARHLGVSWDTVKEIEKRYLKQAFGAPPLRGLRAIAIDELYLGRTGKFLTIVLDLESGAIVHVGEGKGDEALHSFWKKLRRAGAAIEAVAMDMSPAYAAAVAEHLPQAAVIFDHFHVIKLFNQKLTDLRRDLYHEATAKLQKQVLKGTRWLLLKRPDHLDPAKDEAQRLHEALALNQTLATAYYLREELSEFWNQPDKASAASFLQDWINRAFTTGVRILHDIAKSLASHRSGLLAYYDFKLTTAKLEGTNRKIRTLLCRAYGYRDKEFLTLKLYALHCSKYALVG
jgi:transposase